MPLFHLPAGDQRLDKKWIIVPVIAAAAPAAGIIIYVQPAIRANDAADQQTTQKQPEAPTPTQPSPQTANPVPL